MSLSPREVAELRKIIAIAEKLLAKAVATPRQFEKAPAPSRRSVTARRSGKELIAFRKMVKAERKRGVPVAEIARKYAITPNYIYQIS